ncbi:MULTISPECIES: tRNA (adenosine(37)-N6)-threonylcarbamoyltransferase complex ATPase subunit type 1 TsaE [unclassified Agrococcus]|uniref:tRNA (adenosine(37)-N6)-threonylcarbamoyltransferase complex ATPase subunit type 1 TsaE n=1 Tax=unclassified Agrococcus TaxID=2615065 RepID=UPI0036159328
MSAEQHGRAAPRRVATVDLAGRVVRLVGEVVSTKRVPAGHGVSYGSDHVTAGETTLALVALGYADGVPRTASGAAPVTVDGVAHPIAGRVAMDQVVLDVGDAVVEHGAEAVLWGSGGTAVEAWGDAARVPARLLEAFVGPRVDVVVEGVVGDADAMEGLGRRLSAVLGAGDVVVLTGELGAGKTTLTRGIGDGLGAIGTVQSPTFVIARTHRTATVPLLHVDAYRLGDEAELDDLDLDVDASITIAEWGLPLVHAVDAWLHVEIERPIGGEADADDEPRRIRLTGHGDRWPASRLLAFARGSA